MHPSSIENMARLHARYLAQGARAARQDVAVLDVGGADINGGYRQVFADPRFRYVTADVSAAPGVDVVMDDPYRLPFGDASQDVVLSGQMLEHCEFFWLSFVDMVRVLKPDGLLFLIVPSAGPIHRYPVDCYRFYPDAFAALARYAGCHLVESWLDERGPWRDLVGVFSRTPLAAPATTPIAAGQPCAPPATPGSPDEEATAGGASYLDVLARLHADLQPAQYLEIGVRRGNSLALATGAAIGVDPAADTAGLILPGITRLIAMESDEFFRERAKDEMQGPPDLAFIDGMHWFEYALRDFMHIERLAGPGSLVVLDDIFPVHPAQAERERRTRVWTGDVWKLHACLAELRPDLVLVALDTSPTGLLLVAGLDPDNRVLWEGYNPQVRRYREPATPPASVLARSGAWDPSDPRLATFLSTLRRAREHSVPPGGLREQLRAI
jgi:predicted O-methyltransferase YrrM